MPKIIPIRDLKNTSEISALCQQSNEPIFISKNGYGDMVIMSMELYEETLLLQEVYQKLNEGEKDILEGKVKGATSCLASLRQKYGV